MTLAKATVTGIVYKEPKTGYTQNNVAVSSFVMNVGETEEVLVRVISKKQTLSSVVDSLTKNSKVLVSGRLQTGVSKLDDGTEKKVFEIDASSIELFGAVSSGDISVSTDGGDILSFGDMESSTQSEVLIEDEEVPF